MVDGLRQSEVSLGPAAGIVAGETELHLCRIGRRCRGGGPSHPRAPLPGSRIRSRCERWESRNSSGSRGHPSSSRSVCAASCWSTPCSAAWARRLRGKRYKHARYAPTPETNGSARAPFSKPCKGLKHHPPARTFRILPVSAGSSPPPSSSGLGYLVLSQKTGVRFPVGVFAAP